MKKVYALFALLVIGILAVVYFSQKPSGNNETHIPQESGPQGNYVAASVGDYDSLDTAIVVKRSLLDKTISLRNLQTGKQYTLSYNGTSVLFDASGAPLSMEQIKPGLIVDVSFLKTKKKLVSLQESTTAFVFRDTSDFRVSESGASITIGDSKYKISPDAVVASELDIVSVLDIHDGDVITIRGFDREVYSISLSRGHGYLRLENDAAFIGGWIEVGTSLIRPITENLMLTVPEGTYDVSVSNKGSGGTKTVTIERGQEVTLDIGDLVSEVKSGSIIFEIEPAEARVYIDGERSDMSEPITLTYGIHQVIFKAEGYVTLAKYVKVGQEMATLTIEMEKEKVSSAEITPSITPTPEETQAAVVTPPAQEVPASVTPTAVPTPPVGAVGTPLPSQQPMLTQITIPDYSVTVLPSVTPVEQINGDIYYVHITSPENVEVYVDGSYVGIAPVKFRKQSGSHEIILRKSGCQTRSYTLEIDDAESDISYAFSQLRELIE